MDTMIREGGTKTRNFWKIRKKLLKNNEYLEKHMKDEDGNDIKNLKALTHSRGALLRLFDIGFGQIEDILGIILVKEFFKKSN